MSAEKNTERFNKWVTMLIASVAIWVAITVFFQNYASNSAEQARRRAQENAIASTKEQLNGEIQFNYQFYGAYQTWSEINAQITAAQEEGDTEAEDRYKKLQERVAKVSRLLGSDYFPSDYLSPNLQHTSPDQWKYQADDYLVKYTSLNEKYIAESEFAQATDKTADDLVVQITLLTVSLSLYGLSVTLKGKVRWLFVIIGSGIVGVCVLWLTVSLVLFAMRPDVNDAAIKAAIAAYSEGVGLAYQGESAKAIAQFDTAIAAKPDYGRAYSERAAAYLDIYDYSSAIENYETARKTGFDDALTNGNLGWAYYLNGQFEKSIEASQRAMKQSDSYKIGIHANEALAYLGMGDMSNSKKQYDALLEETQQQVNEAHSNKTEPPAYTWYFLDASATDLQNLIDQLGYGDNSVVGAPPVESIPGDHEALRSFAFQQMIRLKEANTALEVNGQLPTAYEVMKIESFSFGQITEKDDQGFVTKFEAAPDFTFAKWTKSFTVEYSYSGPTPTQMIWKVYVNGYEYISLRKVVPSSEICSGPICYKTFGSEYVSGFLPNGDYVVELYADSRLVQTGTFTVKGEE